MVEMEKRRTLSRKDSNLVPIEGPGESLEQRMAVEGEEGRKIGSFFPSERKTPANLAAPPGRRGHPIRPEEAWRGGRRRVGRRRLVLEDIIDEDTSLSMAHLLLFPLPPRRVEGGK